MSALGGSLPAGYVWVNGQIYEAGGRKLTATESRFSAPQGRSRKPKPFAAWCSPPSSQLPPASNPCPDSGRPNPGPDAQGRLHSCSVAECIVTAEALRVLRTLIASRMRFVRVPTIQQR